MNTGSNDPTWHSYRCESNGCVEVAFVDGDGDDDMLIRDSKNSGGPVLRFTGAEWRAFVDGIRAGEFPPEAHSR